MTEKPLYHSEIERLAEMQMMQYRLDALSKELARKRALIGFHCEGCNQRLIEPFYRLLDKTNGRKYRVCSHCIPDLGFEVEGPFKL